MPFVQAKCPECGGMLAVDADKKAANCQFCGEAFIVQEAINNYNTYNETINNYNTTHQYGDGAVVNVYEEKSKDFVIEAGVLKEYHGESIDVVVPEGVRSISKNCFKGMQINSLYFPQSLIIFPKGCLDNIPTLKTINVDKNNVVFSVFDNVLFIKSCMNNITSDYICENCDYQSSKWYSQCPCCSEWNTLKELESKTLPQGMSSIAYFCEDKDNYTIPNNVYRMEELAFDKAKHFKHLYWNDYDLKHLPCNEVSVINEIENKFPYRLEHDYVDGKCKFCYEYDLHYLCKYISFGMVGNITHATVYFLSKEKAILTLDEGWLIQCLKLDEISKSLKEELSKIKILVLFHLNDSKSNFHSYGKCSPSYSIYEGYNRLFSLFSNIEELIIEEDTGYYDSKEEKYYSILEELLNHINCNKIVFGEKVPKEIANPIKEKMELKVKQKKHETQMKNWHQQNKCQYCGGDFKYPLFGTIKCKNCGKPKDY